MTSNNSKSKRLNIVAIAVYSSAYARLWSRGLSNRVLVSFVTWLDKYSLDAETHAIAMSKGYKELSQAMDLVFRAEPSLRLETERFVKDV